MRRTLAVVVLTACCLAATAGLAGAVHEETTDDTLVIELEADGDATVTHLTTYNLSVDDEREAYDALANDEAALADHRDGAVSDLEAAAATGRNGSELDMRVRDPQAETFERNGTGYAAVDVTWTNVAYYNETLIAVTEPFRSGYEPDRDVTVHGPEGYSRGTVFPAPGIARMNSAAWTGDRTDFSEFYAAFEAPEDGEETPEPTTQSTATSEADGGLEGTSVFLRAFALAALPAAALLVALKRRRE